MMNPPLILQNNVVLLRLIQREDLEEFAGLTGDQPMWNYFTSDLSIPEELKK